MKNVILCEYLQVGDRVVMNLDRDARGYAAKGVSPNGTVGTVVGFYRFKNYVPFSGVRPGGLAPGVYEENGVPYIDFDDGFRSRSGLGGHAVAFADQAVAETRQAERGSYEKLHGLGSWIDLRRNRLWIGDLHETKFYPHDTVAVENDPDGDVARWEIGNIDYHWFDRHVGHHADQGCYTVYAYDAEGRSMFSRTVWDEDLRLVKRGPIWAHYHDEEYRFTDLREEASTARLLGRSSEVRNPSSGMFAWSEAEWKRALQRGEIDAISIDRGLAQMLQMNPSVQATRFDDRDLGERVRQESLEGFDLEDLKQAA